MHNIKDAMRWIKDSVHGDIPIEAWADPVIDTPEMQRLRRISQTSFTNIIYPGANHTRFEHSLGVYYLTGEACRYGNLDEGISKSLQCIALLHDVGHSAFSHALEGTLVKFTGKNHEDYTKEKIQQGSLKEAVYNPREIVRMMKNPVTKLVTGDLGTDRMDYLLRDAHYTGVAYGSVDYKRLMRKLSIEEDKLALDEKGVGSAEAMLNARLLMFPGIYEHPVAKIAESMLTRAVERAIESKVLKAESLTKLDDWSLMCFLKEQEGYTGEMADRILNRNLYKTAFKIPLKEAAGSVEENAETRIAERCGLERDEVIIHVSKPWFRGIDVRVRKGDKLIQLEKVSTVVSTLEKAQWDYCFVSVFCDAENREKVKKAAESYFLR
jgi:HD superfamily phosphohydrolase